MVISVTLIIILFRELDFDLGAKEKTIVQRLDCPFSVALVNFYKG